MKYVFNPDQPHMAGVIHSWSGISIIEKLACLRTHLKASKLFSPKGGSFGNGGDYESGGGYFLGVSGIGIGVLIGTNNGIPKTTDYRTAPEGRWNRQLVFDVATSFEQYVLPTADAEVLVIDAQTEVPEGAPIQIAEGIRIARRPRMERPDFLRSMYTG